MLHLRPRNQVLTEKEILAAVVSRLEKGSEAEEDQKNAPELQGGGANSELRLLLLLLLLNKYVKVNT